MWYNPKQSAIGNTGGSTEKKYHIILKKAHKQEQGSSSALNMFFLQAMPAMATAFLGLWR